MLRHPRFDDTDFSSMRVAAIGAASIPAELVRRIRTRIGCPVIVRYTSTEACVTTSTDLDDPPEVVANTVGKPVAGVELELVGDDGHSVAPGSVGSVRCRSCAVMKGYWNNPRLTAEAIDSQGWLRTGDLAYFDDENNLRIAGRKKDMYIRGGYNVYPAEVEEVLHRHALVADAAVVGVPDSVLGEIGTVYVVPDGETAASLTDLRSWVCAALADYKAPDRLERVESIPRNSMGKIDRTALIEMATRAQASA
jgi:acyl-CoA synthetase (AMP-forming)/AMP-acid ligase II